MIHLLDVNVLIALIDSTHVFHNATHRWFAIHSPAGWATCPITENGLVRIISKPSYPNSALMPGVAVSLLCNLCVLPGHEFWPDEVSIRDSAAFDAARISAASRITDAYLLALAAFKHGRLATFDRQLAVDSVHGGVEALHVIAGP